MWIPLFREKVKKFYDHFKLSSYSCPSLIKQNNLYIHIYIYISILLSNIK